MKTLSSDYLNEFLSEFAVRIQIADAKRPQEIPYAGKLYQVGIGPFTENGTVDLVLEEFPEDWNGCKFERFVNLPSFPKHKCDLDHFVVCYLYLLIFLCLALGYFGIRHR